jgi:hypothetical protein
LWWADESGMGITITIPNKRKKKKHKHWVGLADIVAKIHQISIMII